LKKPIIAVVTGASRGAGKGIAIALGKKGAVVYITGRSLNNDNVNSGTITQTAFEVNQAGGIGIPVVVDHTNDFMVAKLFERIKKEYGRLDILVNNAADVNEAITKKIPFWENSLEPLRLLNVGLRSHYVSSYYAAPLLIANGKGLIVNTGQYAAVSYYNGPAYGAQKAGSDKMAADMAKELRPYNVAVVSIWMGFLDTERAQAYIATLPDDKKPTAKRESPEFTGRIIAGLYEYKKMLDLSAQALIGAEIAEELGITDIDGSQPKSFRETMGAPPELHKSLKD
jgi:NAD(P)-dependent dehydrogenase (short-subunit alcohol dehydrogenase family)